MSAAMANGAAPRLKTALEKSTTPKRFMETPRRFATMCLPLLQSTLHRIVILYRPNPPHSPHLDEHLDTGDASMNGRRISATIHVLAFGLSAAAFGLLTSLPSQAQPPAA